MMDSQLNEFESIFDSIYPQQINLKSFERKENLCPKIWMDFELKKEIRRRLMTIVDDFLQSFDDFEINPDDVVLVGSITGYNWSKYSDIDLHIMVDINKYSGYANPEVLKDLFNVKKNIWNEKHSIEIYGYEIELYVQDINEENASDGIYSVKYDKWIKIPKLKDASFDKELVKKQASQYINIIDTIEKLSQRKLSPKQYEMLHDEAERLNDEISTGRKEGLANEGENSAGNIVFKVLRRTDHLGKLKRVKISLFDKMCSLYI